MTLPLFLVRHGESEWNRLGLTQGQTPHPPLTAAGRSQAEQAADLIAADLARLSLTCDQVRSSDLIRATQTADIIASTLDCPMTTDSRLREQHLGEFEGLSYDDAWSRADLLDWSRPGVHPPGGESLQQVHDRIATALADLEPDRVTVLVSHGDAIRAAVAHLHRLEPHQAPWVAIANGAVLAVSPGPTLRWLSER